MINENILFQKNDIKICKNSINHYTLEFILENNNILLYKIINIDLIKLLYDLNQDIYEELIYEKINDTMVKMIIVIKHLFQELGLVQRFTNLLIEEKIIDEKIYFFIKSNYEKLEFIPKLAEQIPIDNINICCTIINNHKIEIISNILLENNNIEPYIEKLTCILLSKILNKFKLFIEKLNV
jgi:hypothetical protein